MIVCPNCSHQNPDGAIQCEACYTPLPSMVDCPTCGASVQSDASFCGQCGANLSLSPSAPLPDPVSANTTGPDIPDPLATTEGLNAIDIPDVTVPDLVEFEPLVSSEPLPDLDPFQPNLDPLQAETQAPISSPAESPGSSAMSQTLPAATETEAEAAPLSPIPEPESVQNPTETPGITPTFKSTQIQTQAVQLLHTHTNTMVDVPPHLTVVHIGKPNDRVPPDIDVSGFKDSEVVSRVHADIRVEGDSYYIEDMGSSNGTYINNIPLSPGNRHKLRSGDRIALGKGDKVSFIIQIT